MHRFKKGHRMMIQIQSTWFPLVDRNPQKFVPNIYFANRRFPEGDSSTLEIPRLSDEDLCQHSPITRRIVRRQSKAAR